MQRIGKINVRFRPAIAALVVVSAAFGSASASTITVASPDFDNPPSQYAAGAWANLDPAWTNGVTPNSLLYYENNGDNMPPDSGSWSAYLPNTGTISQDLSTVVTAGETLSVTFRGGNGTGNPATTGGGIGLATFVVNGTDYSSQFDTTIAPTGEWDTYTLTKTITNSGDLTLQFGNVSGNPFLDTISNVTVTPVPEPASGVLLVLAAMGLGLTALRRRWTAKHMSL